MSILKAKQLNLAVNGISRIAFLHLTENIYELVPKIQEAYFII